MFRINGMYYSLIGTLLVAVCGYLISIATGGNENLDPKLLSPLFRGFYKPEVEKIVNRDSYKECCVDEIEKVKLRGNENIDDGGIEVLEVEAKEKV